MKKRIVAIFSVAVLMVVLVSSLAACVPSRPDKYIQRLLAANSWSVTTINKEGEIASVNAKDGNIIYASNSKVVQYMVIGKSSIETYTYKDEVWSYEIETKKESVDTIRDTVLHQNIDDLELLDLPSLKEMSKNFVEKFKKENGKWYERNTKPACIYVSKSDLYFETNTGHKTFCFSLSCSLKLPKEALQAKSDANV